jgi:hypothetical protein
MLTCSITKSAPLWRVTAALPERPDASGRFDDDVASARFDGLGYPEAARCREGGVTRAIVSESDPELYAGGTVCVALLARRVAGVLSGRSGVEIADSE